MHEILGVEQIEVLSACLGDDLVVWLLARAAGDMSVKAGCIVGAEHTTFEWTREKR